MDENAGKIWGTFAYAVIFLVAVVGNSLIIHLIRKHPSMKTTFNLLLINMAVADLLIAFFMMPYTVAYNFDQNRTWFQGPFGEITCRTTLLMIHIPIAASIITLTVMAFERFFAIKRQRHVRRVRLVSFLIWLCSLIVMSPFAVAVKLEENSTNASSCRPKWDVIGDPQRIPQVYYTSTFVLFYGVPLLIMAALYSNIVLPVWKRRLPGEITQHNQLIAKKRKRQVVRLLVVIVLVFAAFWFPTQFAHCLPWYGVKPPAEVWFYMFFLGQCNSAINPCLCLALNSKFRDALRQTMSGRQMSRMNTAAFLRRSNSVRETRV